MNMKLISVVTPPPAIYHNFYTQNTLWEEKLSLMNITSVGRRNVWKQREINNGEKYMIFYISSKLDCLDKREVTSSEPKDYMLIPGKVLSTYMDLRTKS